jgi:hypothetical protein
MIYGEMLDRVIVDGIAAAVADYDRADQENQRDGSVRGFNDCRGKTPEELIVLLGEAESRATEAHFANRDDYWYWRCRALEVEWVCNVVSAALRIQLAGHLPTARGAIKAAEIVGVS